MYRVRLGNTPVKKGGGVSEGVIVHWAMRMRMMRMIYLRG